MLDKFIAGAVLTAIVVGTPTLYRLGKEKKAESIQHGKIYYGLLWCRIIVLFLAAVISSELILMVLLGNSVEGTTALLLLLLCSLPLTALYVYLYRKGFKKKYLTSSQ